MTDNDVLTPGEMARLFNVDPKTITRWDKAGKFEPGTVFRTPGGQRRFRKAQVMALLGQEKEK